MSWPNSKSARPKCLAANTSLERTREGYSAKLSRRRARLSTHLSQLRRAPFGPVSRKEGIRQRGQWPGTSIGFVEDRHVRSNTAIERTRGP